MTQQAKHWNNFVGIDIPSSLELFSQFFTYVQPSMKILDLGCGYGKTTLDLYDKGFTDIYGVDVSESGILAAQTESVKRNDSLTNRFFVADALQLPFESNLFDCVITQAFWTSIETDERALIAQEIHRVLRPNGLWYAAIWIQSWELEKYRMRYENGITKGLERGSFEVLDQSNNFRYIAHHFTEEETRVLIEDNGFMIINYCHEKAPTQSGSLINCDVVIAVKTS